MIDSHTHLDRSPGTDAELVAAAREAGVRRILTVGTDSASCRAAIAAAEAHEEVYAAVGRHPNDSTGYDGRGHRRAARARPPPEGARDRRDRPRRLPRLRAARRPGARLLRPHGARARDRQAARHPHARRRGRHDRDARPRGGRARGDPALLLDARSARRVPRARLVDLLRRQRHLPEGAGARGGGRARAARPPAGRDRRAVPDAAGRSASTATSRPSSSTRRASSPSAAGSPTRSSRRPWTPTPPGCSRW